MLFILSSICGFLSMIAMILSYIFGKRAGAENKSAYFKFQLCANGLFGLQFLFLKAYSACFTSLFGMTKNIVFMHEEKKSKCVSLKWLLFYEVIYIITGVFTYEGIVSLIPIFITVVYTWAAWQPNFKIVCIVGIIVGLLWIVYNLYVGAYVAIISSLVESVSGAVGLVKTLKSNAVTTVDG